MINNEDKKKQGIIRIAESLFILNGFTETTTSLIVKKAMISKRTLYKFFENKEELYIEVIKKNHTLFVNRQRVDDKVYSFRDGLIRLFMLDDDTGHEFDIKRNQFLQVSLKDSVENPDIYRQLYESGILHPREVLIHWIEEQIDAGAIMPGNVELWANMIMSFVFGALIPRRKNFDDFDKCKHEAIKFIDIFIAGIHHVGDSVS